MARYSRPFHKSSRVRHFAAGAGGILLLFTLGAATRVAIAPMKPDDEVVVAVDIKDIPCDEPYEDRAEVIPDTLNGKVRFTIVIRDRECCCCGDYDRGTLRRPGGGQGEPPPRSEVPPPPRRDTVSVSRFEYPELVPPVGPGTPPEAPPLLTNVPTPGTPPLIRQARVPWWLGLAAAPLLFFRGDENRPPGGVCEDETGRNSGPPRHGCWPDNETLAVAPRPS